MQVEEQRYVFLFYWWFCCFLDGLLWAIQRRFQNLIECVALLQTAQPRANGVLLSTWRSQTGKKKCLAFSAIHFCNPFFKRDFPILSLLPRRKSWKKCLPPPSAPLNQGKQWHPLNESAVNKTGNLRGIKRRTEGFIWTEYTTTNVYRNERW